MKGVCAKNNCELTRSSLWILASINEQINSFQTSSTYGMPIKLASNCQTELHLSMLKYYSNWVIWNLFILGGLLRYTIISNTKMIPLSKVSMLQRSASYHMCKQCLHTIRKIFRWTETTKEFLVVFSLFSWKHNFVWSFESIDLFFAKYTSHCHFFDYMYGSKGSNGVKKQKKGPYFRKINFGEKFRRWKISFGKNFRRLLISSVKNFHQLKVTKLFKNIVTFNRRNFNQ